MDHEDAKGTKSTKHEEHEGVRCRVHFLRVFALRVLRGLSCLRDPNTFPPVATAFAWQQYRQQGRGCTVIDVAQAKDPPPGEAHLFGETLGAYVPYKIVRGTGDADRQEAGRDHPCRK